MTPLYALTLARQQMAAFLRDLDRLKADAARLHDVAGKATGLDWHAGMGLIEGELSSLWTEGHRILVDLERRFQEANAPVPVNGKETSC